MAPLVRRDGDISAMQHKGKTPGEERQLEIDCVLFVMCFVWPGSILVSIRILIFMSRYTYTHLLVFECYLGLRQHRWAEGNRGQPQLAVISHL